jgi:hypothetical protein
MSGSGNQPNRRGRQSSQQGGQRQGGQRQGGQQQGGQQQGGYSQQQGGYSQQQGGYSQQQGGYGQPPQGTGGGSAVQTLQQPGPMRFLKGSAILGALGGLIFSLMMILIGKIGGFPILPGATDTARSTAGVASTTTGTGGTSTQDAFDATLATSHETIIAYMSTELAPFLAFGLAIVVGVLVATRLDAAGSTKMATAGVGMFAGGLLLVVIASAVIGFLGPEIPDVLLRQQGLGAAAGAVDTSLASPEFGNIIFNGVFAGLGSAATAAATVFSLDNFMLE